MSVSLPLPMPAINDWLKSATDQLKARGIDSSRLDAEILLAHTLKKSRTYLHAHPERLIEPRDEEIANARLDLRLERTPIAYIVGYKEFFGRQFKVTSATLIPRPESEDIISTVKSLTEINPSIFQDHRELIDVGTGSGCLGITLKLELPEFNVTLSDISQTALNVAEKNAHVLGAKVITLKSNLLDDYPLQADFIVANLPYVDPSWERSPETDYEPPTALFADDGGLEYMIKLIAQAKANLKPNGYLILEADPEQHPALKVYADQSDLKFVSASNYCVVFQQV
jgi:release factor glutamine methyltransferase